MALLLRSIIRREKTIRQKNEAAPRSHNRTNARTHRSQFLFVEFDVPIGEVEEILPALAFAVAEDKGNDGTPLGAHGLAHQTHVCLVREPVGLAGIATDARAHDVFPRRLAAAVARW